MSGFLTVTGDGVTLRIKVQPRASKNEIAGIQGDELKVRLTSPPVDGAANESCREFLASLLKVPRQDVLVTQGEKSRHKLLRVRTPDPAAVQSRLAEWLEG
ncbi:MAG: YggU family protein [Deltaproteobacteria bacterium]|nr:YggU family protein [Deltaproteobacteria bacterium]